jgi:hypothetical protein
MHEQSYDSFCEMKRRGIVSKGSRMVKYEIKNINKYILITLVMISGMVKKNNT